MGDIYHLEFEVFFVCLLKERTVADIEYSDIIGILNNNKNSTFFFQIPQTLILSREPNTLSPLDIPPTIFSHELREGGGEGQTTD